MTDIKKTNDLQEEANKIQKELKDVIKKYNKITVFLTIIIIFLTLLTLYGSLFNKTGRYAISQVEKGRVYVLDTKTSQLWLRMPSVNLYFGTNKNPVVERIPEQATTFEEIDPIEGQNQ